VNTHVNSDQLALEPLQANEPALEARVKHAVTHPSELLAQSADPEDFDWDDPEEDSIVLREQRATAVYRNMKGEVVIRQRCWPDDDSFLFISPENEVGFMEAMAARLRK
jgi:hypothetical protein